VFGNLPPVTRGLILVNVAVFLLEQTTGVRTAAAYLGLWPLGTPMFMPWQIITYAFLHEGFAHIFFNMFGLFMFGGPVERLFGPRRFLNLYLASIITAGISQLAFAAFSGAPPVPTIGASGGVFGVLLAFAMYFPRQTILLLIPPIPMPAWLFVLLYGVLELYLGVTGTEAGVAHFAHLGGMLGAWLLIQYWRGGPPFRRRR